MTSAVISPAAAPLPPAARPPRLSRRQKAAIVVRLLLREGAELSLQDLPEAMQIDLTQAMGALRMVDRATLDIVVGEFLAELQAIGMASSGIEDALDLLEGTLSPESVRQIRQKAGIPVKGDPWAAIAALDLAKLVDLVHSESIEIAAVILSKLPVKRAAEILGHLPGDLARRITYAVSTTGAVDPATVRSVGLTIAAQLCTERPPAFPEAPVARVGAILNSSSSATREELLQGLEAADAAFARQVRKEIFTFTNIPARVSPQDVPRIARAMDQGRLVQALAAAAASEADTAAAEFLLANMSQRLATQLRDEMQELGAVRRDEGEAAMSAVTETIRNMQAAGDLQFVTEEAA